MRRPFYLNRSKASNQQGFVLFIVLMMMIVIAFLVVAATQSYNTEMRIGSNDADRKLSMSLAEAALRQGEGDILNLNAPTFSQNCNNGLCAVAGAVAEEHGEIRITAENTNTVAWERECNNARTCLEVNGRTYAVGNNTDVSIQPRYIIEFISSNPSETSSNSSVLTTYHYRVTARAWGVNANTVVTVQSYVQVVDEAPQ